MSKVARTIILKDNKILLGFKIKAKAWELPGGKLEEGESPLDCAFRETFEECGISLAKEMLIYSNEDFERVGYFVFDISKTNLKPKVQPNEAHDKWDFFEFPLKENLRETSKLIIQDWSRRIS